MKMIVHSILWDSTFTPHSLLPERHCQGNHQIWQEWLESIICYTTLADSWKLWLVISASIICHHLLCFSVLHIVPDNWNSSEYSAVIEYLCTLDSFCCKSHSMLSAKHCIDTGKHRVILEPHHRIYLYLRIHVLCTGVMWRQEVNVILG